MDDKPVGAWLVLAVALINLLFHVTMLTFNLIGVPLGLIH